MRRGNLFWGAVLLLVGVFLLLENLGLLSGLGVNVWDLFWPSIIILFGVWILWGTLITRRLGTNQEVEIPIEGASRAKIRLRHGAGRLRLAAGADSHNLLQGSFGVGLDFKSKRIGDTLEVDIRGPRDDFMVFPWSWRPGQYDWTVGLNRDIPLALDLSVGANETRLDLSELRVTDLLLQTGASSTNLITPAETGHTRAEIQSGLAALNIQIPSGVAAKIRVKSGLSGINIDKDRFPRSGNEYRSADYDTAPNKIEMLVEMGMGSVNIL